MQRGAVLVVGLIMLLLLTVIGMASIRSAGLQESMAGNMRDRNLAFQAAEAGLRIAEKTLSAAGTVNFDGSVNGYWPDLNVQPQTGSIPLTRPLTWDEATWEAKSVKITANTLKEVADQPRFVIEEINVPITATNVGGAIDSESLDKMTDANFYRVTSRGVGGTKDSEIILQSTFIR